MPRMEGREFNISITAGTVVKTIFILVVAYILFLLRSIVLDVLTAIVIASAIEPGVAGLVRRRVPRILAVILIYIVLFSVFFGLFYFSTTKLAKFVNGRSALVLILSLIPMGIDVALASLRIHESTTTTRAITGLIFGLALSALLVPVLEELTNKFLSRLRTHARSFNLRNQQSAQNPRNLSNHIRISNATETR